MQKPYLSPFLERGPLIPISYLWALSEAPPYALASICPELSTIILNAVAEINLSSLLMGLTWSLYVLQNSGAFACHISFGNLRTK